MNDVTRSRIAELRCEDGRYDSYGAGDNSAGPEDFRLLEEPGT